MEIIYIILALIIGYLLGSISPAYFLGKILKGIDIREEESGNAGARNVYRVLGLGPAIITAIIDLSKGVLAIVLTSLFVSPFFAILSGLAAIVGHIYPFYLNFRAGQGGATAAGLLIYFIVIILVNHWFSLTALFILLLSGLIVVYITKLGPLSGLTILPFFIAFLWLEGHLNLITGFILVVTIFAWIQLLRQFIRGKKQFFRGKKWIFINKISKNQKKELLRWRTLMRPLAVLFPIIYILSGKTIILLMVGILALIFILVDLSRLSFKKFNILLLRGLIIKKREKKVFSSMSFFTLACFIIFLIFEKPIAITAVFFLIFGDLAAKYFGILFGRKKFFNKTLEGTLAYFAFCLLFGFLLSHFLNISLFMIFLGSLVAAITEALPIGVDDNFTVGLLSAAVMYLVRFV